MIWALTILGIVTALLMGIGTVWLTNEVRLFALGLAPVALAAVAIVTYYELQTKRRLEMLKSAKLDIEPVEAQKDSGRAAWGHKSRRTFDQKEKMSVNMNLYMLIGSAIGTIEAAALSQRLAAWHDAMVMHERRLRAGRTNHGCGDECAHGEARALWAEAVTTFGHRAHDLSFLRSRAMTATGPFQMFSDAR
jgi:hypothetical protein